MRTYCVILLTKMKDLGARSLSVTLFHVWIPLHSCCEAAAIILFEGKVGKQKWIPSTGACLKTG